MVQQTIEDFNGHTWEIFFMDMSKFPTEQTAEYKQRIANNFVNDHGSFSSNSNSQTPAKYSGHPDR